MRITDNPIKVGRSHDVPRRAKELYAEILQIWPGMGHLEAQVHWILDEWMVYREVFKCPLEAIERVVEHCRMLDTKIKTESIVLRHDFD